MLQQISDTQTVITFLKEMAAQLGTTTTYLWSVLIKQASVIAYMNLFAAGIILLISTIAMLSRKKVFATMDDNMTVTDGITVAKFFYVAILLIILPILSFILTTFAIQSLLNPEYWAFKEILSSIKK